MSYERWDRANKQYLDHIQVASACFQKVFLFLLYLIFATQLQQDLTHQGFSYQRFLNLSSNFLYLPVINEHVTRQTYFRPHFKILIFNEKLKKRIVHLPQNKLHLENVVINCSQTAKIVPLDGPFGAANIIKS